MKKLMLSIFALAAVVLNANALPPTAVLKADAELLTQVSITTTTNGVDLGATVAGGELQFGKIGLPGVASTVLVSAAGLRTAGTGTPGVSNLSTAPSAAGFYIGGGAGLTYTITIPASLPLTGGGGACTVDNFVVTGTVLTRTIPVGGKDAFAVGGTLNIPAAATAATITGQINVGVAYN